MSEYLRNRKFSYSEYAEKLLKKIENELPTKSKIKWVYEDVSTDGHDNYGAEAYLYNLFVIVFDKESNLFKYYFYHTEYWYDCDRTEVSYVLEKECVSKSYSPVKRYQDFCKI